MIIRRSKLEIFLDVLSVIKSERKNSTNIRYSANLSWKMLQRTVESMVDQGLIREVYTRDGRGNLTIKTYEITQKGENFAEFFKRAEELIGIRKGVNIQSEVNSSLVGSPNT